MMNPLEPTPTGFRVRLPFGSGKQAKFSIPLKDEATAAKRATALRSLAEDVRRLPAEEARLILTRAAEARTEAAFTIICKTAAQELQPATKVLAP
jgi:hypothetical protein